MIQLPQRFNKTQGAAVLLATVLFLIPSFEHVVYADILSCSITTAAACTGGTNTVILRMSGTSNAHAELPGQVNVNYDGSVICCSGVIGLGNSCSGTYDTILKLSGTSNAHVEQNSQSNYANNACVSVPSGGIVSVGYQATTCASPLLFDTTLGSIDVTTNSHIGNSSAYLTKICATASGPQSLTFSISDGTIGFGTLVASGARYATGDTIGSGSNTSDAHTISVVTNASGGYVLTLSGTTLTSGGNTIATTSANTASTVGSEQFGLRLISNSGNGTVSSPYADSGFAFDSSNFPDGVASGVGDSVTTVFGTRYIGNISANTEQGSYSSTLTYVLTATF
ncbi:MAG: hypothetical protein EXS50_02690 [Candidatus Taylorbacteria bacterium]|nr:hypothetical protein [Candidatus Taylorbacteria bacterium]